MKVKDKLQALLYGLIELEHLICGDGKWRYSPKFGGTTFHNCNDETQEGAIEKVLAFILKNKGLSIR